MQLSKSEQQLMEYLWNMDKAFMKELIEAFPDPKPASTTVATLLKRMSDKGFVGHTVFGNSRQYFPLVKRADYFTKHVKGIIKNNFENSAFQFASFFTKTSNLSEEELKELRKIIDQQIQKKKK
jgi:BlaI family penicillinase repressor